MLDYEKDFTESNFHNINLVPSKDFPKTIALIYQDYKNSTDFYSHDKPRAFIQTNVSKSASRISNSLKSKLSNLHSEGENELNTRLLSQRKSHTRVSHTRLQTFTSDTQQPATAILRTEMSDNHPSIEADNYYHPKNANRGQEYLTPQRGQKMNDESMHAYLDNQNRSLEQNSPNVNGFKPEQKNEVSPLHQYRIKGRDPFLQRLSEYKGIYDSFKYKYESKFPQKTESEPAKPEKHENLRINTEGRPENITRNEVIIQEDTPSSIGLRNPPKNPPIHQQETAQEYQKHLHNPAPTQNFQEYQKPSRNPAPVIQQETPPAQQNFQEYQKPSRNHAPIPQQETPPHHKEYQYQKVPRNNIPVIQQDIPPAEGARQSQRSVPRARQQQQQETPPSKASKGLRISQHSSMGSDKETTPARDSKLPKYPTPNDISPISGGPDAREHKHNNNYNYHRNHVPSSQETPTDLDSTKNFKASLNDRDAQRTIKKNDYHKQGQMTRPDRSFELRRANKGTQFAASDMEMEEDFHDKAVQAEIYVPKKNAFTVKKRQSSITDIHKQMEYKLPESQDVPPKLLKRGGIKNNYTPREEELPQEPFYRHEKQKVLPTRSTSQEHYGAQRKVPEPLEGRVPLRNQISAQKLHGPEHSRLETSDSESQGETTEIPRKKRLSAVRVSRKEQPSLKKIQDSRSQIDNLKGLDQREDRLPAVLREKLYRNDASLRSLLSQSHHNHEDYYEQSSKREPAPRHSHNPNHRQREERNDPKNKKLKALHESAFDFSHRDEPHHHYEERARSAARQRKNKLSPIRSNPMGEESYRNFTHTISTLIANYSNPLGDYEPEMLISRFIEEIKYHHPILSKFSYRALKEIIQGCNILNIKNTEVYREKEHNEYSYIILYGEVFLKSKAFGVFKHCQIGECVGEEALIDGNYTKQETAQVIDATALIEVNQAFVDSFKEVIGEGYRGDYTLLLGMMRKSLTNKKGTKQRMVTGKK